MRKLDLTKDSADYLTGLEAKQARQVWNKIVALMKDPRPNDSIDIGENFFRSDIGERRIVYRFDDNCVYIAVVGNRNDGDVYKQFRKKK